MQVAIKGTGAVESAAMVTDAQDRTFTRSFPGQGADDDIVVSSVRAYIAAINKMRSFLIQRGLVKGLQLAPEDAGQAPEGDGESGSGGSGSSGGSGEEAGARELEATAA